MKIGVWQFRIIQGLFIIGLLLGGVTLAYFALAPGDALRQDARTLEELSVLQRYQGTADIYRSRMHSYDGVCEGLILVNTAYTCHQTEDAYAIEKPLPDGTFACADSTGYRGIMFRSKDTAVACQ